MEKYIVIWLKQWFNKSMANIIIISRRKEYLFKIKIKPLIICENNNFTGMPKEPQYKAKNSKITFKQQAERFNNNGTVLIIGKQNISYIKTIKRIT